MKKLILTLFVLLFAVCGYAQNVRQIIQTNDILTAQQQPKRIGWWQGETIQYDIAVERGGDAVSLSTGSTFAVWYVTSTSSLSLQYIVNTGILANATGGLVRITTTASEANLATGTYFSSVRLYDVSGGVTANVGTVARGLADVFWSPDFASYSIVTGQVVTTLVFNVTLGGSTGGVGSITNIASLSPILSVSNGAGPQANLHIVTSALVSALSSSFATGTALYVEADTQAIAQVGTASNALRVGIGLGVTNLTANGFVITNLQGQVTTNLTRLGLLETNVFALGVVVTNGAGAITTNLTRLGLLETNHLALGVSVTNVDGRVTTNLTRLGLLETNHIGQGVSLTNAHGAISTNLTRLGLAETNHTGLGVSVTNNAGAISTNLTRLGALETNHLGLGVSVTNVNGRVTTNLTAQGLIATNLTQVGLVVTNLSGLVTTNYVEAGLWITNAVRAGLSITNLQGLVSSNHLADGVTQTNLQGQIMTNLVAAGLIRTNLVQVGLVVTNLSGLVTTNYTAQGLVQSNLAVVAAQVTNNLVLQGAIDTNLTWLTTNAVSKTWTNGQEIASALHSRDRLSALTNLTVAATNAAGSEVLNNGTFTGSEAGWSLTNASYNANSLLVLPSATASITYTQAVITAGKVYQLSFANTLAYGSNFTLFAVSIGGFTNVFPYAPTGTHTMTVATWTEQPLVFRATPGTNQLVLDTVSVKEDLNGDLWVARRAVIGREANIGGNLTVASNITAGTISGNATGYLPLVGGTMSGPVTNELPIYAASGADGWVKLSVETNAGAISGVLTLRENQSAGDFRIWVQDAGVSKVGSGSTTGDLWTSINDGSGSGLDADTIDGISVIASGNTFGALSGPNLTNLNAANLAAGGTFGALNAANLTNLPAAATTAGVNNVSHTGAVSGNLTFSDGTGVDVSQTNAAFYWSVIPGAVSGIDGRTLTNAVPMNLGTGAVALASLGNVAQTGQVNSITYTGGTARGNITFSGSGVSQTGAQDFVFTAGGGGSLGLWATNAHLGPVTALHFIGTASITGEEGFVTAGAGGGDTFATNVLNAVADVGVTGAETNQPLCFDGVNWTNCLLYYWTGGGTISTSSPVSTNYVAWELYYYKGETNGGWTEGTMTQMHLVTHASNVLRDVGATKIGRPFVDPTNNLFYMPVGYFSLRVLYGSDGTSAGINSASNGLFLTVNGNGADVNYWNYWNDGGGTNTGPGGVWNTIAHKGIAKYQGEATLYNTNAANEWRLIGTNGSAGTAFGLYRLHAVCEFLGN